jgi:hypothetical protein
LTGLTRLSRLSALRRGLRALRSALTRRLRALTRLTRLRTGPAALRHGHVLGTGQMTVLVRVGAVEIESLELRSFSARDLAVAVRVCLLERRQLALLRQCDPSESNGY